MSNIRTFSNAPYYDDFKDENDFLQILFRPGFAVQTREVNQLQTILQNQIGRMSDGIYPDGTKVVGGNTQFNIKYAFVKLKPSMVPELNGEGFSASEPSTYIGNKITNVNGSLSATIVLALNSTNTDPSTFYVQYTGVDSINNSTSSFGNNEPLTITRSDNSSEVVYTATTNATGFGSSISISDGVFYVKSRFVSVHSQTIILTKYVQIDPDSEYAVGINMVEKIVIPEEDLSLLDNASGTTNETAPGAHRYLIRGDFVLKSTLTDLKNFIEIVKFRNSVVVEKARPNEFSVFDEVLAKRTFDESGDYVVDEFLLDVREHLKEGNNLGVYTAIQGGDETKLVYQLDPGRAYVRGYKVETESNTLIEVNKSREYSTRNDVAINLPFNTFIEVNAIVSGLPKLFSLLLLKIGPTVTASAVVRNITYVSAGTFRIELVAMSNTVYFNLVDNLSGTSFSASAVGTARNVNFDSTVYPLPIHFNKSIEDIEVSYFKEFEASIVRNDIANTGTIQLVSGTDTFSGNASDYLIYFLDGANHQTVIPTSPPVLGINIVTLTTIEPINIADGLGLECKIVCRMTRQNGVSKVKTLLNSTESKPSAISIILDKSDGLSVTTIMNGALNVTDRFSFDGGQRDDVYSNASINLKDGEVLPMGTLVIEYSFFDHSIGDFFSVQSYSGISYDKIPYYTDTKGNRTFLADAIDFRNKLLVSGGVESNIVTTANTFETNSQIFLTSSYYLARTDKIVVNTRGKFSVLKGIPSDSPEPPNDINDSLTLYRVNIPAYTFSAKDSSVKKIQQRRYTMKDVGNLDMRIQNLEYYTSLNLLEIDTANRNFENTFKSGFIVDTFETQGVADNTSNDLKCAFDIENNECRPQSTSRQINLEIDTSNGIVVKDGIAMLDYTEIVAISQPLASMTERIQPFIRYSFNGDVILNPSTDNWFTEVYKPDVIMDNGVYTIFDDTNEFVARGRGHPTWKFVHGVWRNTWAGTPVGGINVRSAENSSPVVTNQLINVTQIGDRILNNSTIPYIRSRSISFNATGLKPNVIVKPFFDGTDVSSFVNNGSPLIVSPSGSLNGAFIIPSNDTVRFRTGVKLFVLADDKDNPTTEATALYTATGIVTERQKEFVGTRVVIQKRKTLTWYDPVAESFVIDEEGGAYITSIGIFLGPEVLTNTKPVTVQIRNMSNGYPGSSILASKTLPFNIISGSEDASIETIFEFDAPVYIDSMREMCFVVISESETLTLWTAKLGQRSVLQGDTISASGQIINRQSYLGSMFKSQNNTTWSAAQDQDIKFTIRRAKFNVGSASITMKNNTNPSDIGFEGDVYKTLLLDNSLFTIDSNPDIVVSHADHGFKVGDIVKLNTDNGVNGISAATLSNPAGWPIIWVVDIDSYIINVSTNANGTGKGGVGVSATQKTSFSAGFLLSDEISLNGTNISWQVSTTEKTNNLSSAPLSILPKTDIQFTTEKTINSDGDGTLKLTAILTNTINNISPTIDTIRTGFVSVSNRIDLSGSMASYVIKNFTFINPANKLKVIFDINRPFGTSVDVYYRNGADDIYTIMPITRGGNNTSKFTDFIEDEYDTINTIPNFTNVQVKVVFKSDSVVYVPRIKNFRVISLME